MDHLSIDQLTQMSNEPEPFKIPINEDWIEQAFDVIEIPDMPLDEEMRSQLSHWNYCVIA